jgi:hypothetical protein
MPELTWMTAIAWFGVLTGAASVAGLIVALTGNRTVKTMHRETQDTLKSIHHETQDTLKSMHNGTQDTLKSMDATTKETLRALGEGQKSLGEAVKGVGEAVQGISTGQTALAQILDRMDRAAEARYRDLKDRLDGGVGPRG